MVIKLDFHFSICYISIVKAVGFFLLTMFITAVNSESWITNPIALTQSKSPFCFGDKIMKSTHNEYLFIKEVNKEFLRIDKDGRIWRIAIKRGKNKYWKINPRKINDLSNSGYIQICLQENGKRYRCYAHRLVWIYFNGKIPDSLEINHKNGIKLDNHPENLELVTHSENHKHAFRIGLRDYKGTNHPRVKLKEKDVMEIRRRCSSGELQKNIAKGFNVGTSNINLIIKRKRWAHIV